MAAVVASSLLDALGIGSVAGLESTLLKGALGGVIALGTKELIQAIENDLGKGGAAAQVAGRVPKYAIVDLHNNTTVRFLSSRKVYSILTHPSRRGRGRSRTPRIQVIPAGSDLVSVR